LAWSTVNASLPSMAASADRSGLLTSEATKKAHHHEGERFTFELLVGTFAQKRALVNSRLPVEFTNNHMPEVKPMKREYGTGVQSHIPRGVEAIAKRG